MWFGEEMGAGMNKQLAEGVGKNSKFEREAKWRTFGATYKRFLSENVMLKKEVCSHDAALASLSALKIV